MTTEPDVAEQGLTWLAHGRYLLKGVDEAVEVFEAGVEGLSPLAPPPEKLPPKKRRASSTLS